MTQREKGSKMDNGEHQGHDDICVQGRVCSLALKTDNVKHTAACDSKFGPRGGGYGMSVDL